MAPSSAPKRSSEARICIDSTIPTAKPDTAIRGSKRQPISYSWRAVSLISKGGRNISRSARPANTTAYPAPARGVTMNVRAKPGICSKCTPKSCDAPIGNTNTIVRRAEAAGKPIVLLYLS